MVKVKDPNSRDAAVHRLTKTHRVTRFRIHLEGESDKRLLAGFLHERKPPWRLWDGDGKGSVIEKVMGTLTRKVQRSLAIGIVDMDGHWPGNRLGRDLEKAAKEEERLDVLDLLEKSIQDTSEDVCLMSTLDSMVGGDWIDVYSSDLKRKHGLKIEQSDWEAIFCVARYRSWFHAGSQTARKDHPPEFEPDLNALKSQRPELEPHQCAWVKEKNNIAFSDWKDIMEATGEAQNSDVWGQWNDHVLSATVLDFLREQYGVQSPSTKKEVEDGIVEAFRYSIKRRKLMLDDFLTRLGFDIDAVLKAQLARFEGKTQTST